MRIDSVYNYEGREIFVAESVLVKKWLVEKNIPRDYRVLVEGMRQPITVNTYLTPRSRFEGIILEPPIPAVPYQDFERETTVDPTYHIDDELVPKWELMNPKQERLLWSDELENGMVVLTEEMTYRYEITDDMDPMQKALVMKYNRFCMVTKLEKLDDGAITFVGVYDDGLQATRHGERRDGWIVKKYSLPQVPVETDDFTPTHQVKPMRSLDGGRWIKKTNLETGEVTYYDVTKTGSDDGGETWTTKYDQEKGEITYRPEPATGTDETPDI